LSDPFNWRFGDEIGPVREAVREGRIVAIPTESSYALAVDPRLEKGVRSVYAVKTREVGKPLPVVVSGVWQIEALGGRVDEPVVQRLIAGWPAALSLVVPIDGALPAAAGGGSLAFRVPEHEPLRQLLDQLGTGLTATSANRSGQVALTHPDGVRELLEDVPGSVVVDDGVLPGGQPSTLVSVRDGVVELLRPGRIGSDEIERLLDAGRDDWCFSAASVEILADESS